MWWDERSKIARSCVAKLILKSKRQKHLMFGALLKVEMFKSARRFWRERSENFWRWGCRKSARRCGAKMRQAHFEVNMQQAC